MDLGLRGRTALVGGGSAGLGRASAERLAGEGCRLALWSRGGEALERAAAEIRATYSAEVVTISGDASQPETAARVAAEAEKALGRIDIVILNAGGPPASLATRIDTAEWRRSFQLLAITPIELASLLLPAMRQRGWGRIVAILSSGVRQPIPELAYSNACRSALQAWLKTIAPEIITDGVTVNGVLPGRFDTARVAFLDRTRAERDRLHGAGGSGRAGTLDPGGSVRHTGRARRLRRLALLGPRPLPDGHLRADRRGHDASSSVSGADTRGRPSASGTGAQSPRWPEERRPKLPQRPVYGSQSSATVSTIDDAGPSCSSSSSRSTSSRGPSTTHRTLPSCSLETHPVRPRWLA